MEKALYNEHIYLISEHGNDSTSEKGWGESKVMILLPNSKECDDIFL